MKYSSVILAGGLGTRLRPLTDTVPKPMLPVGGEPNLVRLCEQLLKNGFDSAVVTLGYLPDKIRRLGNSCRGVDLHYVTEKEPLGTAGAVKAVSDLLCDDFAVVSGDSVCMLDLASALEAHKKRNAAVTVVLHTVSHPCEYGGVVCDEAGRIVCFREKPSWQQVVSDKVNTGIYILSKRVTEYIPDGISCDFSRDVFPKMIDAGEAVFGFEAEGYWRDMGSFSEYLEANRDLSGGNGAETEGSVCGDGFSMGNNSAFINSVALDGVRIADNCSITGSILARNVIIGDGCVLRDGCVVGEGAVINDGVKLGAGTVIGCGKTVTNDRGDSVTVRELRFINGAVSQSDVENRAEELCRLAYAAADASEGPVAVCCGPRTGDENAASIFARALCGAGGEAYELGYAPEAAARFAASYCGCKLSVYFYGKDGDLFAGFCDDTGCVISTSLQKKICRAYSSPSERAARECGSVQRMSGLMLLYYRDLTAAADLRGARITLTGCEDTAGAAKALKKAGAATAAPDDAYGEDLFIINCGDGASLLGQNGTYCGADACLLMLLSLITPDEYPTVSLPYFLPDVYERTAEKNGIKVRRYSSRPSDRRDTEITARKLIPSCRFTVDPLFCAAILIGKLIKNRMSLAEAAEKYAGRVIKRENISAPQSRKASYMRRLYEAYMPYQTTGCDGVRIIENDAEGVAAADDTESIRVVISADTEEAAEDAVTEIMMKLGILRS